MYSHTWHAVSQLEFVLCYRAPFVRIVCLSLADQAVAWSSGHTGHRRPDGRWRTACPLTSLLLMAWSTTISLSFVFVVGDRTCQVVVASSYPLTCESRTVALLPCQLVVSSPLVTSRHLSLLRLLTFSTLDAACTQADSAMMPAQASAFRTHLQSRGFDLVADRACFFCFSVFPVFPRFSPLHVYLFSIHLYFLCTCSTFI